MAHLALGEDRVLRLLHGLAMAVRDAPAARNATGGFEISGCQNADNAIHTGRGCGVDAVDCAMSHIRAQEVGMCLSSDVDVVCVPAFTGQKA